MSIENPEMDIDNADVKLKKYLQLRKKFVKPAAFGEAIQEMPSEEWNPVLFEMIAFCCELDWMPTAKVQDETEPFKPGDMKKYNKWCVEHCEGEYYYWSEACIVFEKPEDAVHFKMVWC